MKKAIVLGHSYTASGVIEALASSGVEVLYLSTSPNGHEFSHFSRLVSELIKVASPEEGEGKLLELLTGKKLNWDGALLMPTTDLSLAFVSKNREILTTRYVTAVEKWDIVQKILNKGSLYLRAHEIGVPAPRILFPESVESLKKNKVFLGYPCVLKPCESPRFFELSNKKLFLVHNFEELVEKYLWAKDHELEVMVSEFIPGDDSSLFHYRSYIDSHGDVLAEMCTQKLQQNPPNFGVARVAKTIPMIEEMRRLSLKLLRSFSYRGVSSVEFKLDSKDSQFKLMEINVRPVVPERLFVAAGINFPYITYLDVVEKSRTPTLSYHSEIYWIDPFSEFYELVRMLGRKRFAVGEYFFPYRGKRKVLCVPFWNDPIPFIARSFDLAKTIVSHAMNRVGS